MSDKLRFTKHLWDRMILRGISVKDIYSAINKGRKVKVKKGYGYISGNILVIQDAVTEKVLTCYKLKRFFIKNGEKEYCHKKY